MILPTKHAASAVVRMIIVSLLTVLCDQGSKALILAKMTRSHLRPVIPGFFNLTLTFNPGAAFGFLANVPDGMRQILLGLTTACALGAVIYFLLNDYRKDPIAQIALAMIVGGAIGNIIDRLRFGAVVDFLDVYLGSSHWPAFNIADSAICVGVAILLLRKPKKHLHPLSDEPLAMSEGAADNVRHESEPNAH